MTLLMTLRNKFKYRKKTSI